jgi:hypothetical protein
MSASGAPARVLLGALALSLSACGEILGLDGYHFERPEEMPQQTPGQPLEPGANPPPSMNNPPGMAPGGPDGTGLTPAPGDGGPDDARDGGASVDAGLPAEDAASPVTPPPPPVPVPRPILVSEPAPLPQLIGSATGGEARTTNCPGGVLRGLFFQYYPDRLSFVWPACGLLQTSESNLTDGESFDANWIDGSPDDPVFAPLRDTESFGLISCPANQYVVGISGSYDDPVNPSVAFRSVSIQCAALNADPERSLVSSGTVGSLSTAGIEPANGAFAFTQPCPAGSAATQLELRFGAWLDAIGLRCSAVRLPFAAGHACAGGVDCQSGSCGAAGVCDP